MIYELKDTKKAEKIFDGWQETMIDSCIKQVMGKIFVTDLKHPKSACAFLGCFAFYSGVPDRELVKNKPEGFVIMVPQNEAWEMLIEECFPAARKVVRYAIKKNTTFDKEKLTGMLKLLPEGYVIRKIDGEIYDECLLNPETADFVSAFPDKEHYLKNGRGIVILKEDQIVSGASSYTRYRQGIEIEVDTIETERRKHLATVACAALILACIEEDLYPSWDAQNMNSVHLAEKLGYEYSHEYTAYEV